MIDWLILSALRLAFFGVFFLPMVILYLGIRAVIPADLFEDGPVFVLVAGSAAFVSGIMFWMGLSNYSPLARRALDRITQRVF
jgi:hypothetical protein